MAAQHARPSCLLTNKMERQTSAVKTRKGTVRAVTVKPKNWLNHYQYRIELRRGPIIDFPHTAFSPPTNVPYPFRMFPSKLKRNACFKGFLKESSLTKRHLYQDSVNKA